MKYPPVQFYRELLEGCAIPYTSILTWLRVLLRISVEVSEKTRRVEPQRLHEEHA